MPTSIKLDPKLKARVDAIAKMQRRAPHWIMVEAIRLYVEREERRQKTDNRLPPWSSFEDRAQDEIKGAPGNATEEDALPPLRPWDEVLVFEANPNPDPQHVERWKRLEALKGAGTPTSTFKSKEEIDAHIRWLRGDD